MSCWTTAGERQSARIRSLYLNAVLRQDIAYFDTELTTGQAVSRMSSDTLVIQDALGEKVTVLFSCALHQVKSHFHPVLLQVLKKRLMNLTTTLSFIHLQAGKLIQLSSTFFSGFIIAFTRGWLLTLVMLTSLPLIAVAGIVSSHFLTNISSKKLASYGDAGDTVEQTIGAIRTVSSIQTMPTISASMN